MLARESSLNRPADCPRPLLDVVGAIEGRACPLPVAMMFEPPPETTIRSRSFS